MRTQVQAAESAAVVGPKTLSEGECLRVAQDVKDNIRQFFSDDGMSFPAEMIIVTGSKPK